MTELNVLEIIKYVYSALVSTSALQLLGLEAILLIIYSISNKFLKDKFIKVAFLIAEILIVFFYAYGSIECVQLFFTNVISNIVEIVYFPTPLELVIVLLISYVISYFASKNSNNNFVKAINAIVPVFNTSVAVAMIRYIDINNIDFNEFSVFTDKVLMSLNEVVMLLFVVWLLFLLIVKVDSYVISKLAKVEETQVDSVIDDFNTVCITPVETESFEDEEDDDEEIEMPRLKADYYL